MSQAIAVQVAAETSAEAAATTLARVIVRARAQQADIRGWVAEAVVHRSRYYRVLLGPFPRRDQAEQLRQALKQDSPGCFLRVVEERRPELALSEPSH